MNDWDNLPYPKKIYEEFKNGTELVKTESFENSVLYDDNNKMITLNVDISWDMELAEFPKLENLRELSADDYNLQKNEIGEFAYLHKDKFTFDFSSQKLFCGNLRLSNILSAAKITYPLGEGLLDFCYADFDFVKGEDEFLRSVSGFSAIPKLESDFLSRRFHFMQSISALSPFINSSIYSLAFPPLFCELSENAFTDYMCYLKLLQGEFLALFDFCFDEKFYPDVLGKLSAVERFGMYCKLFERENSWLHREQFEVTINKADYTKLSEVTITEEHKKFAELVGEDLYTLETLCAIPHTAEFSYQCGSLLSMLRLEFSKMLQSNLRLRKCQYCGKYFVMKGNYNGCNCDRITENNMTCQQLSANKRHKEKTENLLSWKIYRKYYKRYFARNRVGTITDEEFKSWQRNATVMRDDCIDGKISAEEFLLWAQGSFVNNPFKKPVIEILTDFSK